MTAWYHPKTPSQFMPAVQLPRQSDHQTPHWECMSSATKTDSIFSSACQNPELITRSTKHTKVQPNSGSNEPHQVRMQKLSWPCLISLQSNLPAQGASESELPLEASQPELSSPSSMPSGKHSRQTRLYSFRFVFFLFSTISSLSRTMNLR